MRGTTITRSFTRPTRNPRQAAPLAAAVAAVPSAHAQATYDEAVDGDLSGVATDPTVIDFGLGTNSVSGTIGGDFNDPAADASDYFGFSVAPGEAVTGILVDRLDLTPDNFSLTFTAYNGTDATSTTGVSRARGGSILTASSPGRDLIELYGGVLGPGDYAISLFEPTPGQSYTFAFDLEAFVPGVTAPGAAPAELGGSIDGVVGPGEVSFYESDYDGSGGTLTASAGYTLELALFDADGFLVAQNTNQFDDSGEIPLDGLAAGTYFAAFSGEEVGYATGFSAVSNSGTVNSGAFTLDGLTVVPEPAGLTLLAVGGLDLIRRR